MNSRWTAVLATLVFLALNGCGGGGDDPFSGGTTTVFASNLTLFEDGAVDPAPTDLKVGDLATDVQMRIGVRFVLVDPLLLVPTADQVQSATLRLLSTNAVQSPYAALGSVVVDRVNFGLTLGNGDFAAPVLTANLGTISSAPGPGVRDLDVTAAVVAALTAGSLTSDFLLRFTGMSANQLAEYAAFERSTGNGDGPLLLITSR